MAGTKSFHVRIPYVTQFSYSYDLPFGRGKALWAISRLGMTLIGGWKTNGIWRIADGRPMTFLPRRWESLATYGVQRPNIVGKPKHNDGDWVDHYFADTSTDVFQRTPLHAEQRTAGLRRRPYAPVGHQRSVSWETNLAGQGTRGMKLEFRIEARMRSTIPYLARRSYGRRYELRADQLHISGAAREIQLAIKFNF